MEENLNIEQKKEPKKTSGFKKFIIIFLIVIAVIVGSVFGVYKCCIDISEKNIDKFDYLTDWEYDIEEISDTVGNDFKYISSDNVLRLDFPKTLLYEKVIDMNAINDSLNEKYGLNVEQLGFSIDEENSNIIHFYGDTCYKDMINAYVQGTLRYQINSNDIVLYFDSVQIGTLPVSLTSALIPLKAGDEIYRVNSKDIIAKVIPDLDEDGAKLIDENIIDLTYFTNLHSDTVNVGVDFKVVEYVSAFVTKTFGAEYGQFVDAVLPSVIDELVNGLTTSE